jgi:hypothetical protein
MQREAARCLWAPIRHPSALTSHVAIPIRPCLRVTALAGHHGSVRCTALYALTLYATLMFATSARQGSTHIDGFVRAQRMRDILHQGPSAARLGPMKRRHGLQARGTCRMTATLLERQSTVSNEASNDFEEFNKRDYFVHNTANPWIGPYQPAQPHARRTPVRRAAFAQVLKPGEPPKHCLAAAAAPTTLRTRVRPAAGPTRTPDALINIEIGRNSAGIARRPRGPPAAWSVALRRSTLHMLTRPRPRGPRPRRRAQTLGLQDMGSAPPRPRRARGALAFALALAVSAALAGGAHAQLTCTVTSPCSGTCSELCAGSGPAGGRLSRVLSSLVASARRHAAPPPPAGRAPPGKGGPPRLRLQAAPTAFLEPLAAAQGCYHPLLLHPSCPQDELKSGGPEPASGARLLCLPPTACAPHATTLATLQLQTRPAPWPTASRLLPPIQGPWSPS